MFELSSRCSRVYWSTTDARKRCVYTCKIMECRPPVIEPDINSTVEHDNNRTIAHSPVPLAGNLVPALRSLCSPWFCQAAAMKPAWTRIHFRIPSDVIASSGFKDLKKS